MKHKLRKENVDFIPLRPRWPGLLAYPWSLGRLGSRGWTVMGLMELGRMYQPMSPAPWTWRACSPLHGPTTSRPRGSSCSETMPTAPKGCGASGLKELWKSPWAPCLLVLGFQPPASFLGVSPPMDESTLYIVVLKDLGFVQGMGERRRNGTQALGVSPGTFHSDNPGTGLSLRLWCPQ